MFFMFGYAATLAQSPVRFEAGVSSDSVFLGHYFQLAFTLENAGAKNFTLPELDPRLEILSGPNTSSSFSIVNGTSSQKTTYTLLIRPAEAGEFFIPPASVEADGKTLQTAPIAIRVVPNPDGKPQPSTGKRDDFFRMDFGDIFGDFPPAKPAPAEEQKKKRKTVKI